jgi:uncharacterized protein (TIGR00299 family) protein
MTRVAYLDPIGGASGDMLLAALVDVGADPSVLDDTVEALGLDGVELTVERTPAGDLAATRVRVRVPERAEARSATAMRRIVTAASLPDPVRSLATEALNRLARAEADVHGVSDLDDVVLHELGGDDTLVDICGVFGLLHALEVDRVVCAPLPLGRGIVAGDHGLLPAPAPATLALLRGAPLQGVATPGELVTPTAAAVLSTVVEAFGELPPITLEAVGVGAGSLRHRDRPNILRVLLGTTTAEPARGEIVLLEANLDDLTPELAPDAQDACVAAGAIDTWLTPVQMKKGRPGYMLSALARPADERSVADALLQHTSTLGVRVQRMPRYELERVTRELTVDGGTIRVKVGLLRGRVVNAAPEHDDCAAVARLTGRPVKDVWAEALAAAREAREAPVETDELAR